MKTPIEEMLEACGLYDCDQEELYKFAKFIVDECSTWINFNVGMINEDAYNDLLKHLGLEKNEI